MKYHHIFSALHNPNLPFITFQQVVLKDKVTTIMEESFSIKQFISMHLKEKGDQDERPWNTLKVDKAQLEVDSERHYIEE